MKMKKSRNFSWILSAAYLAFASWSFVLYNVLTFAVHLVQDPLMSRAGAPLTSLAMVWGLIFSFFGVQYVLLTLFAKNREKLWLDWNSILLVLAVFGALYLSYFGFNGAQTFLFSILDEFQLEPGVEYYFLLKNMSYASLILGWSCMPALGLVLPQFILRRVFYKDLGLD